MDIEVRFHAFFPLSRFGIEGEEAIALRVDPERFIGAFDPKLTNQQMPPAIISYLSHVWYRTGRYGQPKRVTLVKFCLRP